MFGIESLDEEFERAAEVVRTGTFRASQEDQLKFYAYYKQATIGPCNVPAPGFFDFAGKAKWNAWNSLGDMGKDEAKMAYIDHLNSIIEAAQANGPPGRKERWVPQSQPQYEKEEIADEDKSITDWINEGAYEKVKQLIADDPSLVTSKDEEGRTPLHWATDGGHLEIALMLIEAKADVNAQDSEGQTPLHYAVTCEHTQLVELLVERGAHRDIKDNNGESPDDLLDENMKRSLAKLKV